MSENWMELNLEPAPEEDAAPKRVQPAKIDPRGLAGYTMAMGIIHELIPIEIAWPGKKYNSEEMEMKRAKGCCFSAIAIMEDGRPMIKLVGTFQATWIPKEGQAGPKPYDMTIAIHRIISWARLPGKIVLPELGDDWYRVWPGNKQRGLMPKRVRKEFLQAALDDGWTLERSTEVLS